MRRREARGSRSERVAARSVERHRSGPLGLPTGRAIVGGLLVALSVFGGMNELLPCLRKLILPRAMPLGLGLSSGGTPIAHPVRPVPDPYLAALGDYLSLAATALSRKARLCFLASAVDDRELHSCPASRLFLCDDGVV